MLVQSDCNFVISYNVPMTRQQAIEAKCKDCTYDPLDSGTWRQQVERCDITDCAFSGISNFLLNKSVVFSVWESGRLKTEIVSYFTLWLFIAFASATLVSNLGHFFETLVIPLKILIDICLFFVSYFVQKAYVFRSPRLDRERSS